MPTKPAALSPETVMKTVTDIFAESGLHAKQVLALSHAVLGATFASQAGVANIGRAMAAERESNPKHGIKQFDAFLSNGKFKDEYAQRAHVRFVVGARKQVVATMDWTEYAEDGQHRIALSLVTRHGRSTPLIWKTVTDEELTGRRNDHEDDLLNLFRRVLPETVRDVIILADRGFGDVKLYRHLRELGFHFIIRFRGCITVRDEKGLCTPASALVLPRGRARLIRNAKVTGKREEVVSVVAVKQRGMKDAWFLASSLPWKASKLISLYGRRFTIEENFRDEKDPRFGLGTLNVRFKNPRRRDRFMLVIAVAMTLLTLLGAAGERMGLDRLLRANTVKRRTHSLFRQGREYLCGAFGKIANAASRLLAAFLRAIDLQPKRQLVFGDI
jgi:hypothetical protein